MTSSDKAFSSWLETLRARELERLTFQEVRKGVVALSRIYVEERARLGKAVFDGAGKRAAFACFYTPLHFLLVRAIVVELGAESPPPATVLDLGCGLGAAGAAWALAAGRSPFVVGVERQKWAAKEARRSFKTLRLKGRVLNKAIEYAEAEAANAKRGQAVLAAFAVNELEDAARNTLLEKLLLSRHPVLIVEPIARRVHPWWTSWRAAFEERGGRADEWRFPVELPDWLAELDHASGLDHRELTGKSLFFSTSP